MFGVCDNPKNQVLKDLNLREIATLIPLVIMAFWIGLYPKPFFKVLEKPVAAIVQRVRPDFYSGQAALPSPPGGLGSTMDIPEPSLHPISGDTH